MREWHYADGEQDIGPIQEADLIQYLATGQLSPDTLVWTEGLPDWTPARDLPGLVPPPPAAPVPVPAQPEAYPTAYPAAVSDDPPSGEQARPWVRYWARMIDFFLFCTVAGFVLAFVYEPILDMHDELFAMLFLFIYVFVEPTMLSTWGATPGKALLRIRLRRSDGAKLTYGEALGRAFKVWIFGEGVGIPIVALFTHINAYNKLTNNGITSWDSQGNFRVEHRVIGVWRILLAIFIWMCFIGLMSFGAVEP